jgi:hypothetical protein
VNGEKLEEWNDDDGWSSLKQDGLEEQHLCFLTPEGNRVV